MTYPTVDFQQTAFNQDALELIDEPFAKNKGVILFEKNKLAMLDPGDLETIEFIKFKLNAEIIPYLTTPTSLKFAIQMYKKRIGEEFNKVIEENLKNATFDSILNNIIEHAINLGASDLHIEPLENEVLVRYRLEGMMSEILTLPKEVHPIIVARVKSLDEQSIDIRVKVMPVAHGEKVELRFLKRSARPLSLIELGLSPQALKVVEEGIKKNSGMFLVTGPAGSGKTTTLSAMADSLRSLIRQKSDIIIIDEIRDSKTLDSAVNSALTGHLVLSTLNANDAVTAISRLLDLNAPASLLSSTLNTIIAQRLVRRICNVCDGEGCKACGFSCYRGQIGIFEVLNVSEAIKDLIIHQAPALDIKKKAIEEGMAAMLEDGLVKAESGITTIEEVFSVLEKPPL